MVYIPPEIVIETSLVVGTVYRLKAPELITTSIPHFFIVIAIDGSDNYMLLCTTQLNSKINHLTKKRFDLNTLAYLIPTEENGLTDESYVNCNDYYEITKAELIKKVQSNMLEIRGKVSEEEYQKLIDSAELSTVFDIPKHLLKY